MMRICTSYFYSIRFFKPWQVPVSTALSDPKWFHDFKGSKHKFLDKNKVINGLRAEFLHPNASCEGLCHGRVGCKSTPDECQFLKAYEKQIFSLDRDIVLKKLSKLASAIQAKLKHEVEIVLIVHEAPSNPCSERSVLQKFFQCEELSIHRRQDA